LRVSGFAGPCDNAHSVFRIHTVILMNDSLQRFLFEHTPLRGELVHLDATWQEVLTRHDYPPAVRARLGEMMASCLLLSATLKFNGTVTMQVQGEGAINLLVVEATSRRTVRGMAQWQGEVVAGDLHAQFGAGRLTITIDPGTGGERYQGIVALEGDGLADAIDTYLDRSEQLPTRMWLAADENSAAGMLLQKLPGTDADDDAWNRVQALGATLSAGELLALPAQEIIHRLFHEEEVRLFDTEPVSFHCSCSRERVAGMLHSLGQDEVMDILRSEGAIEVTCEFCNKRYRFDAVDAAQLFAPLPPDVGTTRH
jgi:molecular chaperone Hsp33